MPCIIIGQIKINNMNGGVINFGDTYTISPKSISKSISGSGVNGGGSNQSETNDMSETQGTDSEETKNASN
ncbi:hypothetical protein WQ54_19950 [Bacillus sp. SA1-12]|uniref:spore germination protein n=1 Tax=Bacillus sp. SA1-12 TaxID=1455638 RepID=UPI000627185B|nr:spore germination protein [Bacillus sp. SA1-12]KKI90255.1 hypothetical protein WQ54_19950 [Bacillus sp. SA1-12]